MDTLNAERALLDGQGGAVEERLQAIHRLQENAGDEDLKRFVKALEDSDFGVRWAAAVALTQNGDRALPPLLQALLDHPESVWLREGAHHIFHYSAGPIVRQHAAEFMEATRGAGAASAAADARLSRADATAAGATDWVLLAEPSAPAAAEAADTPRYTIEFRLVRAYRGSPPAEVQPRLRGAGGADPLGDVADTLAVLLPDRRPAVVGVAETELQAGSVALPLSERYALRFVVEREGGGPPRLRDVRLRGADAEVVAEELTLDPDHVYLFGVRGGGGTGARAQAAPDTGELLLAVRLRAQPAPAVQRR